MPAPPHPQSPGHPRLGHCSQMPASLVFPGAQPCSSADQAVCASLWLWIGWRGTVSDLNYTSRNPDTALQCWNLFFEFILSLTANLLSIFLKYPMKYSDVIWYPPVLFRKRISLVHLKVLSFQGKINLIFITVFKYSYFLEKIEWRRVTYKLEREGLSEGLCCIWTVSSSVACFPHKIFLQYSGQLY